MSQIKVENLSIVRDGLMVLSEVNFTVGVGEFVAIVGKSGSGKTTFLQALAGLIPFSGQISIPEGKGMVFQHYAVFPWLTVYENIAFGLESWGKEEKNKVVMEHMRAVQLESKRDVYPGQLSGGQIQRVALARSLAKNPAVLLMDEPYGALDSYTRDQMQQWLLAIWMKYKQTIVFVTHSLEEAIFLADRVLILTQGSLTKEFVVPFARPRTEEIKFTSEFNQLKKEILAAIYPPT